MKRIPPLSGRKWRSLRNLFGMLLLLSVFFLYFGQVSFSPANAAKRQERYELLPEGEVVATIKPNSLEAYIVMREPDGRFRVTNVTNASEAGIPFMPYHAWNNLMRMKYPQNGIAFFEDIVSYGKIIVTDPVRTELPEIHDRRMEYVGNGVFWIDYRKKV